MSNSANLERKPASSPKKKKRKYNIDLTSPQNQNNLKATYPAYCSTNKTISIIDRVLDISKYSKDDSLYKLCREWMNASTNINDISINKVETSTTDEDSELAAIVNKSLTSPSTEPSQLITKLPDPIKDPESELDKIKKLNENIQNEIRCTQEADLDLIRSLNVDQVIESHALLKLHVNRWKSVRKQWMNHYKETNKPYKESYDILKGIFEDI